jgi:hypothetical protein
MGGPALMERMEEKSAKRRSISIEKLINSKGSIFMNCSRKHKTRQTILLTPTKWSAVRRPEILLGATPLGL